MAAPPGETTRPTSDRLRQALFDILWHAEWCGRERLEGAAVLDLFAGTGALGLEALSRGAARATFVEKDRLALTALRANIVACRAEDRSVTLPADATKQLTGAAGPYDMVFIDPPYGRALVSAAVDSVTSQRLLAPGALLIAETGKTEEFGLPAEMLAERAHGAGRITIWRTLEPA